MWETVLRVAVTGTDTRYCWFHREEHCRLTRGYKTRVKRRVTMDGYYSRRALLKAAAVGGAVSVAGVRRPTGVGRSNLGWVGPLPMVEVWADIYEDESDASFDISGGGTGVGVSDVLNDQVDVAMMGRQPEQEEIDQGLFAVPMLVDTVVGTVNVDNPFSTTFRRVGSPARTSRRSLRGRSRTGANSSTPTSTRISSSTAAPTPRPRTSSGETSSAVRTRPTPRTNSGAGRREPRRRSASRGGNRKRRERYLAEQHQLRLRSGKRRTRGRHPAGSAGSRRRRHALGGRVLRDPRVPRRRRRNVSRAAGPRDVPRLERSVRG